MTILFKQISKKRSKKGLKKKDSGAKVQFLVSKKGKYEEHNVTKNIPNHNPNNIFPVLKLKEKEGFNDCLQKAFLGALHGLDLGGVRLEVIAFIRNSFDIVLAASFKGGCKRPAFEQRNHGSLALGYKPGDITAVAKVLNPILAKSGLFLVIKSLKKMNYSKLMNLSTSQRRNRCFIIFGGALASDKRKLLAKQITNCNKSCHTIGSIGCQDLVSQNFYDKNTYSLHAICIKYDAEGRGVIDDPGKPNFYPVTMLTLHDCVGYISDVIECSVTALDI
jgi:hypothetical protein